MIEWDDFYRVAYGAELYGCILNTFAEQIGIPRFAELIRREFHSSVAKHAGDLVSGSESALVLQHIAKTEGPIYSPVNAN